MREQQNKKRKRWFLLIPAVVLALVLFSWARSRKAKVQTFGPIKKGPMVEAVYGIGTVTARRSYQLRVGVAATVREVQVEEGDTVSAGAPLLYLEGLSRFKAPFAGTITSLPYKIGETVFPQVPVLTLVDLKDLYLTVNLEQRGAIQVKKGQIARISFESLRNQTFEGKVRAIFANDSQFIVHVNADRLPSQILPGMTADVAIEISRKDNVLLAPIAAYRNGKIQVQRGSWTHEIPVTLGHVDGEAAEVTSGELQEGDIPILKK